MANILKLYKVATKAAYDSIKVKSTNNLYFVEKYDNGPALFKGEKRYTVSKEELDKILESYSKTGHKHNPADINVNSSNRFVTDTEKSKWNTASTNATNTKKIVENIKMSGSTTSLLNNGEIIIPTIAGPKGEKGVTPLIRVADLNKLEISYTEGKTWYILSDYIAAWFRFTGNTESSQPDNVGKIQISRDNGITWSDLSEEFTNSLHIKGYVATIATLPSSAVQGDIYGVGPTYDLNDTEKINPMYQLYVKDSTGWVNNGKFTSIAAGVVQTTGTSTTEVMSQKAVTEELGVLRERVVFLSEVEYVALEEKDDSKYYYVYEEE